MKNIMRLDNREYSALRPISVELSIIKNATASCFIKYGNTHVICSATIDAKVPPFLRGKNQGWVTAEYNMLPAATHNRMVREITQLRANPRNTEIQRLIGRSLRSSVDLKILGELQIIIDCDVINADGGTRTASITGGYIVLYLAVKSLLEKKILKYNPMVKQIAAVSAGIYNNNVIIDLDYIEDSNAEVDANFIFTSEGEIVEIQACAEQKPFTTDQLMQMLNLSKTCCTQLFEIQNQLLKLS